MRSPLSDAVRGTVRSPLSDAVRGAKRFRLDLAVALPLRDVALARRRPIRPRWGRDLVVLVLVHGLAPDEISFALVAVFVASGTTVGECSVPAVRRERALSPFVAKVRRGGGTLESRPKGTP